MTKGEHYCENYNNLDAIKSAIEAHNECGRYMRLDIPTDTKNCDHCDQYPLLMGMKACLELRVVKPSSAMFEESIMFEESFVGGER